MEISRALSANLPMAMEGIGIFVPIVAATTVKQDDFGSTFFDGSGARFTNSDYACAARARSAFGAYSNILHGRRGSGGIGRSTRCSSMACTCSISRPTSTPQTWVHEGAARRARARSRGNRPLGDKELRQAIDKVLKVASINSNERGHTPVGIQPMSDRNVGPTRQVLRSGSRDRRWRIAVDRSLGFGADICAASAKK